jgi:hypothetical protein
MALLQQLHELRGADDKFVLAGGKACRPLSNMSMLMLLRRMQWCPRSPETK